MGRYFYDSLIYRYFFFGWLFKDVCKGNLYERAAAWQHNLQQARWLPVYMRRWLFVSALMYASGLALESVTAWPYMPAFFYVCMVAGLSVNAVIATSMVGFRYFPAPGNQR